MNGCNADIQIRLVRGLIVRIRLIGKYEGTAKKTGHSVQSRSPECILFHLSTLVHYLEKIWGKDRGAILDYKWFGDF